MRLFASTPPPPVQSTLGFQNVKWTPDGQALLAYTHDRNLSTYLLPEPDSDVDNEQQTTHVANAPGHEPQPKTLIPNHTARCLPGLQAFAAHPSFNIADPSSTLVLMSRKDTPIQLLNGLHEDQSFSQCGVGPSTHSFYLRAPEKDDLVNPQSLAFTSPSVFAAGANNLLSLFDLNRPNEPFHVNITAPARNWRKRAFFPGPVGIISTLALRPLLDPNADASREILAAGTLNRNIGLFPQGGRNNAFTSFSVRADAENYSIGGNGITSCVWSLCGRYLFVAERHSNGTLFYDVRMLHGCIGVCRGRNASSYYRMGIEMLATPQGHALVAGGVDGTIRTWDNPALRGGLVEADDMWKAYDDAVGSVAVDPYGEILATCSGETHIHRYFESKAQPEGSEFTDTLSAGSDSVPSEKKYGRNTLPDHALKLWLP